MSLPAIVCSLTIVLSLTAPVLAKPDPQEAALLAVLKSLKPKPIEHLSAVEARRQPAQPQAVKLLLEQQGKSTEKQPVASVQDSTIPGPAGPIPIRAYKPKGAGAGPFPVLVYFHGGGWVLGSINGFDSSCRALCNAGNCEVISVGYRLAPEHRYPAAHEDCYAATQYVFHHAATFQVDPKRVAVGGESAGGNLAAAVCIMARARHGHMPVHQLLAYPIAGDNLDTPSYRRYATAPILSRAGMRWFFKQYLRTPADGGRPEIDLVRDSAVGLPSTTFIAAEIDPLRSEGYAYSEKLRHDGVPTKYLLYPGVCHGFLELSAVVDQARLAIQASGAELKKAFGTYRDK